MNTHELAWAAGFFDGEGHTGCHMKKNRLGKLYPQVQIEITQKHPGVLHRFREAIGHGTVYGPYTTKRNTQHYALRVYGTEVVRSVLASLAPYLSEEKRLQGEAAMLRFDTAPRGELAA